MTTFLLSRASSISRASSYPLTTPKFHNKVKHTYQDARAASRRKSPRRATTTRRSSTCSATRAGSARVMVFFAPDCPASIPALPPSPRGGGPDEQIGPRDE